METERKEVVWESFERGTRFMTAYDPNKTYEDTKAHKLIATNVSYADGLVLCKQVEDKNISEYLGDLPDELRDPKTDAFIASLIRNGG